MALQISEIESIKIDGSNKKYNGYIYDVQMTVGFNSATNWQVSFISENGEYLTPTLSTETPHSLTIGSGNYDIYPLSYKITKSSNGNLLVVKYGDSSIKYLDKINVTGDKIEKRARIINILPWKVNSGDEIESKFYTSKALLNGMLENSIPLSNKVKSLLNSFSVNSKSLNGKTFKGFLPLNFEGKLRDVLSSIGGLLGVIFYWNWAAGGAGELDCMSEKTDITKSKIEAYKTKIFNEYKSKISSLDFSESIEQNESVSDLSYYTISNEGGETEVVRNARFKLFKPDLTKLRIIDMSSDLPDKQDVLDLCCASLVSKEFFIGYILWNIAVKELRKDKTMELEDPRTGEKDENSSFHTRLDQNIRPNDYVCRIFSELSMGFVYFVDFDKSAEETLNDILQARCPVTAEIFKSTYVEQKDVIEKWYDSKINDGYWLMKTAYSGDKDFEAKMEELYKRINAYAKLISNIYISTRKWDQETLSQYSAPSNNSRFEYNSQNVNSTVFQEFKNIIEAVNEVEKPNVSFNYFIKNQDIDDDMASDGIHDDKEEGNLVLIKNEDRQVMIYGTENYIPVGGADKSQTIKILKTWAYGPPFDKIIIPANYNINSLVRKASQIFDVPQEIYVTFKKNQSVGRTIDRKSLENIVPQNNPLSISNAIDVTRLPDTVEIYDENADDFTRTEKFDLDYWSQFIKQNKLFDPSEPSVEYDITIEGMVEPTPDMIKNGVESININYGTNGISTNLTLSTRRKKQEGIDNKLRMANVELETSQKVKLVNPSTSRLGVKWRAKL